MAPHRMTSKDLVSSAPCGSDLRFDVVPSLLAVLSLACGFPEVDFEAGKGGSSPASSSSTTTSTSASGGGATASGSGGSTSAGGGSGGEGGAGPDPCDLDGDGKPAATPECRAAQGSGGSGGVDYDCDDDGDGIDAVGVPCNGTDCYDANADVFPGQTTYFEVHRGDGSFDYDCSNTTQLEYGSNACGCQGGGTSCPCNQRAVIDGATGCGTSGTYRACATGLLSPLTCEAEGGGIPTVLRCR